MASHREHQGSNSSSVPPFLCPRPPPYVPGSPLFLLACLRKLRSRTRRARARAHGAAPWPLSEGNRTRTSVYQSRTNFLESPIRSSLRMWRNPCQVARSASFEESSGDPTDLVANRINAKGIYPREGFNLSRFAISRTTRDAPSSPRWCPSWPDNLLGYLSAGSPVPRGCGEAWPRAWRGLITA